MNKPISLPFFVAVSFAMGCATTDQIVLDTTKRQPTTNVEIFKEGRLPGRGYREIAELSYLGPREDELKALNRFIGQAKKLGADGIIFTPLYAGVKGGGTVFQSTAWVFKAKVIVFRSAEGQISPAESGTASDNEENNRKAAIDLIGHWESVTLKIKSSKTDVQKMEFDFLANGKMVGTSISHGVKPYLQEGGYSVNGNRLILSSIGTTPDSISYSLAGDRLLLLIGPDEVILERTKKQTP